MNQAMGCGMLAGSALGATAALGYLVVRTAEKDSGYVRWTGRVVGWVLILVGLAGFLCAATSHSLGTCGAGAAGAKMKCHENAAPGGQEGMMPRALPPGHPPIDGTQAPSPKPKS